MARISVDLDDTLFLLRPGDAWRVPSLLVNYKRQVLNEEVAILVQALHRAGHEIMIFTSRPESVRSLTEEQLLKEGVPWDILEMEKPHASLYIDDRAVPYIRGQLPRDFRNAKRRMKRNGSWYRTLHAANNSKPGRPARARQEVGEVR